METRKSEEQSRDIWQWLRSPEVSTCEQLCGGLAELSNSVGAPRRKTILRHLRNFFGWCQQQGFELSYREVPDNLPKYREAPCYLNCIVQSHTTDQPMGSKTREDIRRIKSDRSRTAIRTWNSSFRGEKVRALHTPGGDAAESLLVSGPSATTRRIRVSMEHYVEWALPEESVLGVFGPADSPE